MLCPLCGAETPEAAETCRHCGGDLTLSPTRAGHSPPFQHDPIAFAPGQPFGERYTIVEEVGSGGMGRVYKAIDRVLTRTVALKVIPPEASRPGTLERFKREVTLAQQVTHPNVCRMHDLGEVEGIRFISMEYVDGQTLRDWIQAVGRLSPAQTVTVARQICAGLDAIHRQSIIHRDLKPTNIMLDRSGRVVVMDFGLAYHPKASELTAKGEVLGTLAYLSPEQALGEPPEPRSDIYAFGLVLFEMLTGQRPPADGRSLPLALRDRLERCPAPSEIAPEVPAALDTVVLRCLERDPSSRFSTVKELDRALEQAALAPERRIKPRGQPRLSRPLRLGLGAAAFLAAIGAIAWVLIRPHPPSLPTPVSVALVPLDYHGPPQHAYLSGVLPLLLVRKLRSSPDLEVAPFESSRSFASEDDPRLVARQLGVARVVGGRVDVVEDRVRAVLRMFEAEGGREVWSEEFSGVLPSFLNRTSDMVAAVGGAVGVPQRASLDTALRPDALQRYLEGKTHLEGWDVERNVGLASEAFTRAIESDDRFAEAHAGLALALWKSYEETGRPELVDRAVNEAERAVALGPQLPEAQLAMGVVLLGRGRSVEAATSFERAQELAPADDSVCRRIADAYAALGRLDEAERLYRRAIDLRPGYWDSVNRAGHFYLRTGRLDKAKELFQQVIRLRPEGDTGYVNLAGAHILAGELLEAEPLLQVALRLQPTTWVHNNLGFVYYGTGRFEEAAREFRQAIDSSAERPEPYGNLGDAYRQLGRTAEARDAYARAIELSEERLRVNPSDAERRASLSMRLAGAGRCEEAKRHAAQAVAQAPENPTVHYYVAVGYSICRDIRAATRHAVRAIQGGAVVDVRTNPDLKPLLDSPEIRRLLREPSS